MALIGNGARLGAGPLNVYGASLYTVSPNRWHQPGARKNFAIGAARVSGVTDRAAVPEGYTHPYAREPAQKSGGLASRNRITGTGSVTAANLAGGLNALANLAGSGDVTDAALGLIVSAVADLVGSGSLTADIIGKLEAAAALTGSGAVSSAGLGALASLITALTGTGTVSSASLLAKGSLSADIVVTGDVLSSANVGEAVWNKAAELGFSYGDLMRLLAAVAAGKTTIVDNGGGSATVTFRDLNDTKDRVVADMLGSERDSVTTDPD